MPNGVPINVLWLTKGLGPGGSERLLVAAAGAHSPDRVSVTCAFVLPGKDHLVADLERLGVACTCLAPRGGMLWPLGMRRLLRETKPDIVHIHSPLPGAVARLIIRTFPASVRPKVVTTEHNAQGTYAFPVRVLNSLTSRWDNATIAVSDEARTSLSRTNRERTKVLVHGINIVQVEAERQYRQQMRTELGIGADEMVIGTVANFRRQKDFPNLLNAVKTLRNRGVKFRLVIVGQGPLESETRLLASTLQLDDVVTFTGFRADATRVMSAFDLFVLSSKWEGLPVALMEALAQGLPVVATSVGGVAQVLTNHQDALLVPRKNAAALAKALEQVVLDPVLRRRLALDGRHLADKFDIQRATTEIEQIYDQVVPQPAQRATIVAPRPRKRSGLDVRMATDDDREKMIEAIRGPLQWGGDPRSHARFAWKHDENPFGRSPIWIAVDGDRIVAMRALMQWRFQRGDELLKVARAVDTATDPDYQGRGLFRELTLNGVDELAAQGYDFIFNTPNGQSRPGYLKMGWHDVGKLDLAVLVRPSRAWQTMHARVPAQLSSNPLEIGVDVGEWLDGGGFDSIKPSLPLDVRVLTTPIDEAFLRWRYASPLWEYRVVEQAGAAAIVRSRARGRANEFVVACVLGDPEIGDQLAGEALRRTDCAHALRLGRPNLRRGFTPMPGGPMLTWRAVNRPGMPPLANWRLSLGDIELL